MKCLIIAINCLVLLIAIPVAATTWDVTADFSGTTNPNGAWSYGYETILGSSFIPFTHNGLGYFGSPYWNQPNSGDSPPIVWKNIGPSNWCVANGELSLHPGSNGEYTVVRWTSPYVGTFNISGYFAAGDINPENYIIFVNGNIVFISNLVYEKKTFFLNKTLNSGSTVDFIVGGVYYYGNTPLHATISGNPVPLPPSVWLFGSGLAGLIGLRGFRRA